MRRVPNDADWDRRIARLWGGILAVLILWPFMTQPQTLFVWEVAGKVLEDRSDAPVIQALMVVVGPHALGILVLFVASLVASQKVRGVLYAAGVLLWLFVGSRFALLIMGYPGFRGVGDTFGRVLLLLAMFVLGPALLAAGNRAQKREAGATLARVVAGIGGLAIVAGYFLPIVEMDGHSYKMIDLFAESRAWANAWYFLLWHAGFFIFGLLGVGLLISGGDPARRGRPISVLARVLPVGLMLVVVILMVQTTSGRGSGGAMAMILRGMLIFFGMSVLLAVGLALLVEGPERQPHFDHEEAF